VHEVFLNREIAVQSWTSIINDSGLRCSREFDFKSRMVDSTKIQEWLDQGLKPDLHSINCAVILATHRRNPYCIDPQGQAGRWIRMMESKNDLRIITVLDPRYLSVLQLCSSLSEPVLLEHESGDLDPALYSVLLKERLLSLGSSNSNTGFPKDFRLYITSNNANPHMTQLTTSKVAVINFILSEGALEEQLRTVVYFQKNSDLEAQKQLLVNSLTQNSISLLDLEQSMLNFGMSEEGKVQDYDVAIALFEKIAMNVQEIEDNQGRLHRFEAQICEIQNSYQRFTKRTSLIYFAMMSLSQINVMYQYSLPWFVSLFIQFLQNPHTSPDDVSDVASLEHNCLQFFFRIVCRSVYEKDRLLFSLLLCTLIMKSDGKLQNEELHFLMTGCNDLLETQCSPFQPWLSDKSWQRVLSASELRATSNLSEDIKLHQDGWRAFCESSDLNLKYPGSWAESSPLAKLLIARALREDKMFSAIKCFVSNSIGQQSTETMMYSIADCFADSNPCTPIIIIFSPDYDPVANVHSLASSLCNGSGMQSLVLGQGQGPLAECLIRDAYSAGGWVLLQNCHLFSSWMPVLERICIDFEPKSANENFRLWLTCQMSVSFPISILKNGIKMIYSPPSGLQSTIKRILSSEIHWDENIFSTCKNAVKVKKLCLGMF
jgi:dynein heavy chain, axonemal